ncbi:MAG: hypothetical protein HUJ95_05565 [Bacteroidales bacterium]|nr:hypothetical protein [Bacteroidales bacterium]
MLKPKPRLLILILLLSLHLPLGAQERRVGVNSIGVETAYNLTLFNIDILPNKNEKDFFTVSLGADFTSSSPSTVFRHYPGVRAAVYYHFAPFEWISASGNRYGVNLGPGITVGASRNKDIRPLSPFLGFGMSAQFFFNHKHSPLQFTIALRPMYALYWDIQEKKGDGGVPPPPVMKPFTRGMLCSLFPTISVSYIFPQRGYSYDPFTLKDPEYKRLRLCFESSMMVNVISSYRRQYKCHDGSKYSASGVGMHGQLSRELLFSIGCRTGKYSIVSLLSGYNFNDASNFIPLYIRGVWSFGNRENNRFAYSHCAYIQGGSEIDSLIDKLPDVNLSARIGYGMRFGIPGQLRAIFSVFYNFLYNHPSFYDDTLITKVEVLPENIFLNYQLNHGIGFGVTIAF